MIRFGLSIQLLLFLFFASPLALGSSSLCDGQLSIHCGKTPSAVFDDQGKLLAVFVKGTHIYFTSSSDSGLTYSAPRVVNTVPEKIYARGENRPKIALGKKGEVFVSWTQKTEGRFSGDIRFSRSTDGGEVFSAPRTINDDGLLTSHRFDQMQVTPSGRVYIAWLDKRDKLAVKKQGEEYSGAALYYSTSEDSGASFSANMKVADHSCECCRIASASHGEDEVAVFWRHIFDLNTRDHGLSILTPDGAVDTRRATRDDWKIDACPHHGPHMSNGKNPGDYHLVWFSQGERHKGIYYGSYSVESAEMSNLFAVDQRAGASHPLVSVVGNQVVVFWKYYDGENTRLQMIRSMDGGVQWKPAKTLLLAVGDSDHPQLVVGSNRVQIGWLAEQEGFRVVDIH